MAKTREDLKKYALRTYQQVDGVRLQSLTELELAELRACWGQRYGKTKQIDLVMRRELLVASIVDDDGNTLFAEDEVAELAEWRGAVTQKLYNAASKLNGMDSEDDSDDLGKDSEPALDSD